MWAFLGVITEDPFDSILYPVLLIAGGVATAWLNSVGPWRWSVGILLGEIIAYIIDLRLGLGGPLWAVGFLFLFIYATVAWCGSQAFLLVRRSYR